MSDNNNNHRKSSCEFAEETVAFLYGEDGSGKKAGFEQHFETCAVCADELAAFGFVRSSIREWRDVEFADMATPKIVIPYQVDTAGPDLAGAATDSWFDRIRFMFSRTPTFGAAAAAFAVLAVCLGIVLAIAYYPASEQVAVAPSNVDVKETIPEAAEQQVAIENQSDKQDETASEIAANQNDSSRIPEKRPDAKPARTSSNNKAGNAGTNRFKSNDSTVAKDDKPKPKNNKANSPNLDELIISNFTADEEEEDSLRLADLFDEVGSKK